MSEGQEFDDGILLERIQGGSHMAFATLVRRHAERFYRIAYRFTSDRQEAEDIVQDAFLKLWEHPAQWDAGKGARFTTWFYRIIVNRALDWRRKKKPLRLEEDAVIVDTSPRQDEAAMQTEMQARLEREIAGLPERQRTALNLCFYEGLSNAQAAEVMELNIKALQSLVMRAKTTLKERMARYG